MKTCSKCSIIKEYLLFSKDKAIKADGLKSWCKQCCREYRKQNREALRKANALWRANNRQYYNTMISTWNRANKHAGRLIQARRRAEKLKATPKWLTPEQLNEIKSIYKNCPPGYEVDHIVPLKGKDVRGLHVPWNLQYLTESENSRKSNRAQ